MDSTYLTNNFLIAMPALQDPNFFQTVTYICAHNEEGAMGVVINRPMDVGLGNVLEQMDIECAHQNISDIPIFDGGPVQRERGFVLHRPLSDWDALLTIDDEVGIATSRDILCAIARDEGPKDVLIALGYAGWGAGQLEQEISENAWLSVPADMGILFDTPAEEKWHAAAAHLGVDLSRLSHVAGHA